MAEAKDLAKNHRIFQATIGTNVQGVVSGLAVVVGSPFTCEFDVVRGSYNSMNTMTLKLYNLSEKNRNQIYWDETNYGNLTNARPKVEFKAGYGIPDTSTLPWGLKNTALATCFRGLIWRAYTVRVGTDFVTTIECRDGADAFNSGIIEAAFPKGTYIQSMIDKGVEALEEYGVKRGTISSTYEGISLKGVTVQERAIDYLKKLTSLGIFIDNGLVHALPDNEYILGGIPVISNASGLLGTPQREGHMLLVEMLFEPRLLVFQLVQLETSTGPDIFNGPYKVMSVTHRGMISETVCGTATTSVGLFLGTFGLRLAVAAL